MHGRCFRFKSPTDLIQIARREAGIPLLAFDVISDLRDKRLEQETCTDARGHYKPTSYQATGPNRVWTWDITYFRMSQYTGRFYYVYVIIDLTAVTSSPLAFMKWITTSALGPFVGHGVRPGTLAIHSDNGASMKAASTQALGVKFSHSRPRTWKRNRLSEPTDEAVM